MPLSILRKVKAHKEIHSVLELLTLDVCLTAIQKKNQKSPLVGCLTTDALNGYLKNILSYSKREIVESHLKNCRYCCEELKFIKKSLYL